MRVQLPDGKVAEFPDTMSPQEVESVISGQYSPAPTSTITGKPMKTEEEKAEQTTTFGKKLVKSGTPIAADMLLTAVAPQLTIPKNAARLAKWGPRGLNLITRMLASAAGSGGGELAGQKLTGEDLDFEKAQQEATIGGGAELGTSAGGALLKGASKVAAPLMETALDITGLSSIPKKIFKKKQDVVIREASDRAKKFVDDLGLPKKSKFEAGTGVTDIIKKKTDYTDVYKKYNEAITKDIGDVIELEDSTQFVGNLANHYGDPADPKVIQLILNDFGYKPTSLQGKTVKSMMLNDTVHTEDLKNLVSRITPRGEDYGSVTFATKKAREKLKATLMHDVGQQSFKAKANKKVGDKIFGSAKEFLKTNPTAKRWFQNARMYPGLKVSEIDPSRFVDKLFEAGRPSDLLGLKKEIMSAEGGKEAWAAMEFHWLNNIFESSISKDKRLLQPAALVDKITKQEETIKAIMPDVWPKLEAEMKHLEGVQPYFAKEDLSYTSAYDLLSDKSKFNLKRISKGLGFGVKQATKGAAHLTND